MDVVRNPASGEFFQIEVEDVREVAAGLPPLLDLFWLLVTSLRRRKWRVTVVRGRDNRVMSHDWFRDRDSAVREAERQKQLVTQGRGPSAAPKLGGSSDQS